MDEIMDIVKDVVIFIQSLGFFGGFVLIFFESIIPVLPLSLFIGFNILSFGNVLGFIISYIATVVGCICSFLIFRYVLRDKYERFIDKKNLKRVKKLTDKMTNIDFNVLVVLLACPFTPAYFINIAGGLSKIPFKKFLFSLLISKLSLIYFWGYVGVNFLESIENPIVLVRIFIIILLAYLISKIIEKIIKVEE